jgi:hypothetical protein
MNQIVLANNKIIKRIMEKRDCLIEVADLDPVAYFEEDLVLFIDSEDENIPSSLCVQANFDKLKFDPVKPMGAYLESNSYLPIKDVDARISQRQRLLDEIKPEVIDAMLRDFNQKKGLARKNLVHLTEQFPEWQPGF